MEKSQNLSPTFIGTGIVNKQKSMNNISCWMKKIEVKMKIKSQEKNRVERIVSGWT